MVTVTPALASDGRRIGGTFPFNNTTQTYIFAGGANYGLFRFGPVNVPQGATINSATLTLFEQGGSQPGVNGIALYMEDTDDAAAISTRDPTATVTTAATNIVNNPNNSFATTITSVVQEIVDRTGWSSGNYMMVVMQRTSTADSEYINIEAEEHTNSNEAVLVIDYTAGGGGDGANLLPLLGVG